MKTVRMIQRESGQFKVIRSFWLNGRPVEPGSTVQLDDASLINSLLAGGKIYPADVRTQRRIAPARSAWVEPEKKTHASLGLPASLSAQWKK